MSPNGRSIVFSIIFSVVVCETIGIIISFLSSVSLLLSLISFKSVSDFVFSFLRINFFDKTCADLSMNDDLLCWPFLRSAVSLSITVLFIVWPEIWSLAQTGQMHCCFEPNLVSDIYQTIQMKNILSIHFLMKCFSYFLWILFEYIILINFRNNFYYFIVPCFYRHLI